MDFITHNHRFALDIVESNQELKLLWEEICGAITSITDERLKVEFSKSNAKMSLSDAINKLLDEELVKRNWTPQSAIFQGEEYSDKKWRLDFSKRINNPSAGISGMSIEVAFNHGEAIAWNLMKPVLAAEQNQVELQTEIGSGIGIYICATDELKSAGGFDGAVGEYEKVLRYLLPLFQKLTVPIVIVGLNAPKSFRVEKRKNAITNRNVGVLIDI
jgi:hypothetical protein